MNWRRKQKVLPAPESLTDLLAAAETARRESDAAQRVVAQADRAWREARHELSAREKAVRDELTRLRDEARSAPPEEGK